MPGHAKNAQGSTRLRPGAKSSRKEKAVPPKRQPNVRLMAPFGMKCTQCENTIYKSTKFNARKTPTSEEYLGIKIIQFAIRCPQCGSQIVFQTDPKTSGYLLVKGAKRIVDIHRDLSSERETAEQKLARLEKIKHGGDQPDKVDKLEQSVRDNIKQAEDDKDVLNLMKRVQEARERQSRAR